MGIRKFLVTGLMGAALIVSGLFILIKEAKAQPLPQPTAEIKEVRRPGITCSLKRVPIEPDVVVILAQRREFITQAVIDDCLRDLEKKRFQYAALPLVNALSMRIYHTENMSCYKESPTFAPTRYALFFYSFALTGKEQEIKECLEGAENAIERAAPQREQLPTRDEWQQKV